MLESAAAERLSAGAELNNCLGGEPLRRDKPIEPALSR
jgi:hypothetical protein